MKYYQVSVSAEPKIIGVKNGVCQFKIDYEKVSTENVFQTFFNFFNYCNKAIWKNQYDIKNLEIPEITGEMLNKAKVTDIMGYTPSISFLNEAFSSKYFSILKEYNVNILGAFEIKIKDVLEKYFLLFFKTVVLDEINYEKSIIMTGHPVLNNVKYHRVDNALDYVAFKEKNPTSTFGKICIPKKYFGQDVIKIQSLSYPFYSEKLIDELMKKKIKGLEISFEGSVELIW
jgi:hypothetical protein